MTSQRLKMLNKFTVVSLALSALLFGVWAVQQNQERQIRVGDSPLRNYGVVWGHKLTRSGMPYVGTGWVWLRKQGVRSVVTFRPEDDVNYRQFGFEHILRVPMTGHMLPTDEQVDAYLRFIQDPANQPVHIHCTAGRSRTGVMAALARYAVDGWPLERALSEAKTYRDGKDLSPGLVAWLQNWASRHAPGSYGLHLPATLVPSIRRGE
jgi:hypothetical protein